MPTIYEVAARAGVSPATVSRVLNGQNVSADKAKRVREAARALNFTPNRVARTLRLRSSEVIALVIPDIENPFFTSMARGVEDVAQAAGYSYRTTDGTLAHRWIDNATGSLHADQWAATSPDLDMHQAYTPSV